MSLPPFDPDSTCPKCTAYGAERRYCRALVCREDDLSEEVRKDIAERGLWVDAEHLDRICRECRYQWVEDVHRPPLVAPTRRRRAPVDPEGGSYYPDYPEDAA